MFFFIFKFILKLTTPPNPKIDQPTNQPTNSGVSEIVAALEDALGRLREVNPGVAVTFTVSPVRHLRNAQGPGTE
jgi:hypothetical protein